MPNNFKLSGNIYVSKAGNDSNSGLSPDAPKLTVQAALNILTVGQTLVIGSGVYRESLSTPASNSTTKTNIIGDGTVILDGLGLYTIAINFYIVGIYNITLINYTQLDFGNGSGKYIGYGSFDSLIIKELTTNTGNIVSFFKCIIIGMNCAKNLFANPSYIYTTMYNCIISRSAINSMYALTVLNTYVDVDTVLAPISFTSMNYNNIQGKIVMRTNGVVSGANSNGVALTLAQSKIDYPSFNVNSFSADPLFNNPRILDFTLQAGSPNISASSDFISNIGGTEYAVPFTASSAAFTTNATSQSLQYLGNLYYSISGSATTGSITSGPMFLQWPRTKPLTSVNWIGSLEFNKTITASLAGNNNVPAYTTFTSASGQAGANPDRLKIQMRFSTQQTQPSTDAEWDNGSYWPAGTYQLFEINQKPTIDYKGIGNGDPAYVETSAIGDLVPSWIQTKIILRNDYNL